MKVSNIYTYGKFAVSYDMDKNQMHINSVHLNILLFDCVFWLILSWIWATNYGIS